MHHGLRKIIHFGSANISRQHFERGPHAQATIGCDEPLRHGFIGGEHLAGEAMKSQHSQDAL
jgi:hypothetical protein